MKNRVIVIGANYSSLLGMVRAVGAAEYDITVIKVGVTAKKDLVACSRYVSEYYCLHSENPEVLKDFLLRNCIKKGGKPFLIPIMDQVVRSIDLYYKELSEFFTISNVDESQGGINHLMNKSIQKEIAFRSGFNVANEWRITISNKTFKIPSNIVFPCFTKALSSVNGGKTFIRKCDTKEDLRLVLENAANQWSNTDVLIEEYKEIQKEYGVLGCRVYGQSFLPALVTKMSIGKGEHIGVTIQGKVSSIDEVMPGLKEKLNTFLSHFNYSGLCDFDLYLSEGSIFFNEMNFRFGGFGYAVVGSGVNLPQIYLDAISEKIISNNSFRIKETICLNDKANLDSYISGDISREEYNKRKHNSTFRFMGENGDPKPSKKFSNIERKVKIVVFLRDLGILPFFTRVKSCILGKGKQGEYINKNF